MSSTPHDRQETKIWTYPIKCNPLSPMWVGNSTLKCTRYQKRNIIKCYRYQLVHMTYGYNTVTRNRIARLDFSVGMWTCATLSGVRLGHCDTPPRHPSLRYTVLPHITTPYTTKNDSTTPFVPTRLLLLNSTLNFSYVLPPPLVDPVQRVRYLANIGPRTHRCTVLTPHFVGSTSTCLSVFLLVRVGAPGTVTRTENRFCVILRSPPKTFGGVYSRSSSVYN